MKLTYKKKGTQCTGIQYDGQRAQHLSFEDICQYSINKQKELEARQVAQKT